MEEKTAFYNAPKTISYGAFITMVTASRSRGKTYGFLKAAVKGFLDKGERFAVVRRYTSELKVARPKTFGALIKNDEFPGYEFKVEGPTGLVRKAGKGKGDWRSLCDFVPLSSQTSFKSVDFSDVQKVIFDEFIRPARIRPGYLPNEVDMFFDLVSTIVRRRKNVHFYLLGNSCDLTCPYFSQLARITRVPPTGYSWHNRKKVLLHYEDATDVMDDIRASDFGMLIEGTNYAQMAIENRFANGGDRFVERKPPAAKAVYGLRFEGDEFGVWLSPTDGLNFITAKAPSDATVYALTTADMELDVFMIKRAAPLMQSLMDITTIGGVRFDSPLTRERFFRMCSFFGVR